MHFFSKIIIFLFFFINTNTLFAQSKEVDSLQMQLNKAIQWNDKFAEAANLRSLSMLQAEGGSTFEALKNAQRAIVIFEKLGKKSDVFHTYISIATVHQQLHNGDKILEYCIPALEYAKEAKDTTLLINMLNAVGIGYDEKNDYATAAKYYIECADLENHIGNSPAISYMNASSSLSMLKNTAEGRRYAQLALAQSIKDDDSTAMHYSYGNLALADILDNKLTDAEKALILTEKINPYHEDINANRDLLLLRSMFSAAKGDYKSAYFKFQSFYKIDSTMSSQQRNAQFAELETVYETKRKEAENAQLSSKIDRQRLYILGVISFLLIFAIFALQQRNRLTIKNKALEFEKQQAEKTLDDFTQSLREKTDAFERLKTEIDTKQSFEEKETILAQLSNANILTEEQWRDFRDKFERVHEGFFKQFSQNVPDATEAEKRLAALVKLNLTNSEIASMLGISQESVYKSRYRLKKKLVGNTLEGVVSNM